jgi:hypothetical protein
MNKILAPLLFAALAVLPCRAEPPTQQAIDRLLEVSRSEQAFKDTTANLDQTLRRNVEHYMAGVKLTAADEKTLDAFRVKMTALIAEELNWSKIKAIYEQVYATSYTQAEVDSLIAFYQTPVGVMFAEKQPEISQKTQILMQQRMVPVMSRLRAAVIDTANQIQAAHAADTTAEVPAAPGAAPAAPKSN